MAWSPAIVSVQRIGTGAWRRAVVVERVGTLVDAIGQRLDGAPDALGGLRLHRVPGARDGVDAVALRERLEPRRRDRGRRRLGADVAEALVGAAHVREDQIERLAALAGGVEQPHRRDHETLLLEVTRVRDV